VERCPERASNAALYGLQSERRVYPSDAQSVFSAGISETLPLVLSQSLAYFGAVKSRVHRTAVRKGSARQLLGS
jgi:hypothetical protein